MPIVVKDFKPKGRTDLEIIEKHRNVGDKILWLRKSLETYNKELESLRVKQRQEFETNLTEDSPEWIDVKAEKLLDGIARTFYSAESDEKRELDEKYKEAIDWRGPLMRGVAGRTNGFVFKVYSHDHDQHFHVIHRERGIDARFSFPEIQLINYKNTKNLIGSKEMDRVRSFFQNKEHFERLEEEFRKRDDN